MGKKMTFLLGLVAGLMVGVLAIVMLDAGLVPGWKLRAVPPTQPMETIKQMPYQSLRVGDGYDSMFLVRTNAKQMDVWIDTYYGDTYGGRTWLMDRSIFPLDPFLDQQRRITKFSVSWEPDSIGIALWSGRAISVQIPKLETEYRFFYLESLFPEAGGVVVDDSGPYRELYPDTRQGADISNGRPIPLAVVVYGQLADENAITAFQEDILAHIGEPEQIHPIGERTIIIGGSFH